MIRLKQGTGHTGHGTDSFPRKSVQSMIFLFVVLAMTSNASGEKREKNEDNFNEQVALLENYFDENRSPLQNQNQLVKLTITKEITKFQPNPSPNLSKGEESNHRRGKVLWPIKLKPEPVANLIGGQGGLKEESSMDQPFDEIGTLNNESDIAPLLNTLNNFTEQINNNITNSIESFKNNTHTLLYDLIDKIKNFSTNENNLHEREFDEQKHLLNKIIKKQEELDKLRLPDECIKAIETYRFDLAAKKLSDIDDDSELFYIVRKVYNNQKNNFDILINFEKQIQNANRSLIFYRALYNEMNTNGHKNPIKFLQMLQNIHEKITLGSEVDYKIKNEAKSLMVSICKAELTAFEFKSAVNAEFIIEFAFKIKELLSSTQFENFISEFKYELDQIKNKLPNSVKNIVFSSKVCIGNIEYKDYLYATLTDETTGYYRIDERSVFSWKSKTGEGLTESAGRLSWKFEWINGSIVRIKNHRFNENVYVGNKRINNGNLKVFTRRNSASISDDEKWSIELAGNNVLIKNTDKNEYLVSGISTIPRDVSVNPTLMHTWEISDCPDQ